MNHFERFHRVSLLLHKAGVKHWIDFGTLLGATRDGRLIPGDVDLDINFCRDDLEIVLALRPVLEEQLDLMLFYDAQVGTVRILPKHPHLDLSNDVTAHMSCVNSGVLYLDLYPCQMSGKSVIHNVPEYGFRTLYVEHLESLTFEGFPFPCPSNRRSLLFHRYGPSWREPMRRDVFQQQYRTMIVPFPECIRCLVVGAFPESLPETISTLFLLRRHFDEVLAAPLPDKAAERTFGAPVPPQKEREAALVGTGLVDHCLPSLDKTVDADYLRSYGVSFVAFLGPVLGRTEVSELDEFDMLYRLPMWPL